MRFLIVLMLVCTIVGVAAAVDQPLSNRAPSKELYQGDGASDGRQGGEDFGSPTVIPSIPYCDPGATCGHTHDIAISCVSSTAPDVVYMYMAQFTGEIKADVCDSNYDTALAIFDTSFQELYCNDDLCDLQSEIRHVPVTVGQIYYFVVSGYGTSCGSYVLCVYPDEPCILDCPPRALMENEPDCYDDYYDIYNGGCNSSGWITMCPQDSSSAVMCGKSGTYVYHGMSYRDTDWIRVYGNGETMTATCEAEFPLQLIFIYTTDCNDLYYDIAPPVDPCVPVSLSRQVDTGTEAWIWVGSTEFSGIPCGSDWILWMDNIYCEPSPTERSTWGAIKNMYK
jgi:hypothetical protein